MTTDASRLLRALNGACFDCRGNGNRNNFANRRVPCETCDGTGRLEWYTVAQSSAATRDRSGSVLTISRTLVALAELISARAVAYATRSGVDLYRVAR